jgi:uncharacterized protein (TIGR02246 family)
MTPDEQAIRSLVETWFRATTAGDLEGVMALMADDVVFLGPGRPPMRKPEFVAASRGMEGRMQIDGTSHIQEIRVFGDWAYCWNEIAVTMTPAGGGETVHRTGPALSILHKQADGRWQIVRDANMLAPVNPRRG